MFDYNLNLTIQSILTVTRIIIDISIVWFVLYYAIKIIKNNSRTIQIFKGIVLILVIDSLAKFFGFQTVGKITSMFMNWGFLAIIIIFQPEIRGLLEKLGKSNVFSRISNLSGNEKEQLVDELVKATMVLSENQTGALISIEQAQSLQDYIKTGIVINSNVTAELLTSIFVTSTPLHDGACIIQGDKLACASAYFPPTNIELSNKYGARHRAAIGISEVSDCVTIVVSEETGAVSITEKGTIQVVNKKQLRDYLTRVICGVATDVVNEKGSDGLFVLDNQAVEIEVVEEKEEPKRLKDKLFVKRRNNKKEKATAKEINTESVEIKNEDTSKSEISNSNMKLPQNKKKKALKSKTKKENESSNENVEQNVKPEVQENVEDSVAQQLNLIDDINDDVLDIKASKDDKKGVDENEQK